MRNAEEIKALQKLDQSLCHGIYNRAKILKLSADNGFTFQVPLRYLHRLFQLDILYPQKKLMSLVMHVNPPEKMLIKPDSNKSNFTFEITNAQVKLNYFSLEASFRSSWYSLISQQQIIRVLPYRKETHFTLAKGLSTIFIPSVTVFGALPESIIFVLVKADCHNGNFKNRYAFYPWGLKAIQLMVSGANHVQNSLTTSMDLSKQYNLDVKMWYDNFLSIFPETAQEITLEIFFNDFFIFCYEISPRDKSSKFGDLSLLTSGTCDVSLHFDKQLQYEMILYCFATHHLPIRIDPLGNLL